MCDKESALQWLRYAKRDYESAVLLKTHQHPPAIEIICYHCQQAVEKGLKSILAFAGETIPKTHDIYRLKKLCEKHFPKISEVLSDNNADIFTDFATITRYPDEKGDLTEVEMNFAIMYAKQILEGIEEMRII